jgi:hypothetical protein
LLNDTEKGNRYSSPACRLRIRQRGSGFRRAQIPAERVVLMLRMDSNGNVDKGLVGSLGDSLQGFDVKKQQ